MGSPEDVLVGPSLDVGSDYRETRTRREMWAALKTCWSALVLMWGVTTERQGERCGQP